MVGPARLPPTFFPGLDPSWSKLVQIPGGTTFHVLDHGPAVPRLTVLCVHGNPTWSYLWRKVVAGAPADVRVIAPDHLNMGYSERLAGERTLAERIDDLCALTKAMEVAGPVIAIAHDWGGPISLGWAQRHVPDLAGVVLTNTAVAQPDDGTPPKLITAAGSRALLRSVTQRSNAFVRGALRLSSPEPPPDVRAAYLAPYDSPERRSGITAFVADIPLEFDHTSFSTLEAVANGMQSLAEVPSLLLWGVNDPVFNEQYLHDLEQRLPHADVHRFQGASHFVTEDAQVAEAFWDWVGAQAGQMERRPLDSSGDLQPPAGAASPLVSEFNDGEWLTIEPDAFRERVARVGAGLLGRGVEPGDRLAILIPPGIDLTVVLYACWDSGITAVLVDSGLGVRNMHRAIRAADPEWLIGIPPAMVAARGLRWAGRRLVAGKMDSRLRAALGVEGSLREVEFEGESGTVQQSDHGPTPAPEASAALVVFTSGSTGTSKGVIYGSAALADQREVIRSLYEITERDRLVAAFAPFALLGPALGIGTVVPDMDVAKPATLTASALGAAADRVDATMVFASPAALENVIATADSTNPAERAALTRIRLVMSAGAPLRIETLQAMRQLTPGAEIHTPYGMTELLPVANISLADREERGQGYGTCVGRPVVGVEVRIRALDDLGIPIPLSVAAVGSLGEVEVRADHGKHRYDRLWWTEHRATTVDGWHRTGDVGHLDDNGYLWISGRLQHLINTASGPVAPIPLEHAAERVQGVRRAAAVGVGPRGAQVPVLVVECDGNGVRVPDGLGDAVRSEISDEGLPRPAAVLRAPSIPVDRRHNSKVDRTRVAAWAERALSGSRAGRI